MVKTLRLLFSSALLCLCLQGPLSAQVIWSEDFNSYSNGTTAGTAGAWTSTCGGCLSGDFFEVRSGQFRAGDVNAFSTWETQSIDISGCGSISISLDAIESGDHESTSCGCGVNVDYFDVYYSIDGGAFTVVADWNGDGEATHTLTGDSQNGVFTDNDWVSTTVLVSGLSGNTLQIRVMMRNTAGSEQLILDNVEVDCNSPLPVVWSYFNGYKLDESVSLEWATTAEINNHYFVVERSADSQNFEALGKVNADLTKAASYHFTDYEPLASTAYYRIKQVDLSGDFSYSEVFELKDDFASKSLVVSAPSPNPASNAFGFDLIASQDQDVTVMLTDVSGKQVLEHKYEVQGGTPRNIRLYVPDAAPGMYFLTVKGIDSREVIRIVMQ